MVPYQKEEKAILSSIQSPKLCVRIEDIDHAVKAMKQSSVTNILVSYFRAGGRGDA